MKAARAFFADIFDGVGRFDCFVVGLLLVMLVAALVLRFAVTDYCTSTEGAAVCSDFVKSSMRRPQ